MFLSSFCFFKISGPDAASFLQGQITQHVDQVLPDVPVYTAFCNPEGRVLFLMHVWKRDGAFYFYSPSPCRVAFEAHIKKYSRFSKLMCSDLSDDYEVKVELDTADLSMLKQETPAASATDPFIWEAPLHVEMIRLRSSSSFVQPKDAIEQPESALSLWKVARLSAFYPLLYPETSGLFLAHQLNLHRMQAIHFQKGCYLGQEIIARTQFRGQPKRELRLLKSVESEIEPGVLLKPGQLIRVGDEVVGQLVEQVLDVHHADYLSLAVIENRYIRDQQIDIPGRPELNLKLKPPVVG